MKTKHIFAGIALATTFLVVGSENAQAAKVPDAVEAGFKSKFPTATDVDWDKEGDKGYEASFKMKGIKYSANFSNDGAWEETETPTSFSKLPTAVQSAFNKTNDAKKVKGCYQIDTSEGMIKYEVELKGRGHKEVMYSAEGSLMK